MHFSNQISHSTASRVYATPKDFCRIFDEEMDSLYSLALVLTRNHEQAQQCLLAALEDCSTASTVFPEWAYSWSKRAVIKNAIRLVNPAPGVNSEPEAAQAAIADEMDSSARAYLQLQSFDRFVFVLSVLEGYTIRECAALLGCSWRDVEQARVRGLQQIAAEEHNIVPVSHVSQIRQDSFLAAE